jgi:hypothetical protein
MRRYAWRLGAAALVTLAILPLAPGHAQAEPPENGDNGPGCARGEICFWYDQQDTYQKQFWYSADHGGYFFMYYDQYSYYVSDQPLQDNALMATNRDTQCSVRVGNFSGGLWTWRVLPNDGTRYFLGVVNNRNDRHERCP